MVETPNELTKLLSVLDYSELDYIKNTANIFYMDLVDKNKFISSVRMGYNEYGIASALASYFILNEKNDKNYGYIITEEGIKIYIDHLITHVKKFILKNKPELIHMVV